MDYGLGADGQGGKRQFVRDWWHCIDWHKVQDLADIGRRDRFKRA